MDLSQWFESGGIAPVAQWEAMLNDAGAPKPWRFANAPGRFAAAITYRWPLPGEALHRMNVAEAERLLAALDADRLPAEIARGEAMVRARAAAAAALDELKRRPFRPQARALAQTWHTDAARLFSAYQRFVDPNVGISNEGPAVRFIQAALRRMRHPTVERAAIAQALKRRVRAVKRAQKELQKRDKSSG